MNEKITLELTLDELKLIDKHLWISVATKPILEKIKNAYPVYRSPAEEAYKECYGKYPEPGFSANDWDAATWDAFQKGYEAAQSKAVDEPDWYDEVEWDEKDNPKPAKEVLDRLENKYEKYGGTSYFTDDVIDRVMEKWKEEPPEFLKFELGKTMEQLVERWWCDVFGGINSNFTMEDAIDDLVDRIQLWLPREQDSSGTQRIETEIAVDTHNELLRKIKSKLRNKND